MQRDDVFRLALAKARVTERTVAAWLMSREWLVLPTYDFSGKGDDKAPKLMADSEADSLVIPDLLCARHGEVQWVEVKEKDSASFTNITGRFETGISLRLWEHYTKVRAATGTPVWLFFAHNKEDEVRCGEIASLSPKKRIYGGPRMGRAGMVFFPYHDLTLVCKLSEIRARFPFEVPS
jgi:hypothetical protein